MTLPPWFKHPQTLLNKYNLKAKKSWGQNFLISTKAIEKIADAAVLSRNSTVMEIGPGPGTLTQALIYKGSNGIAIEKDDDMCNVLKREFADNPKFTLLKADAAKLNYAKLLTGKKTTICGNLPYQITGRILKNVLGTIYNCNQSDSDSATLLPQIEKIVFMVQKEVADRLVAKTDTKARGALTIMTDARCKTSIMFTLAPSAFSPAPKVKSSVVLFIPRQEPLYGKTDGDFFDAIVKSAFENRRKTIKNSMLNSKVIKPDRVLPALEMARIDPGARGQSLNTTDFVKLAEAALIAEKSL
jgi:16S rRNA (adenine1518-N6/adenine1519-N6)-dimethyltransferase